MISTAIQQLVNYGLDTGLILPDDDVDGIRLLGMAGKRDALSQHAAGKADRQCQARQHGDTDGQAREETIGEERRMFVVAGRCRSHVRLAPLSGHPGIFQERLFNAVLVVL